MSMQTFDVEFTRDGDVFQPAQVDSLIAGLGPITDLLVLSHGWNNDKADATALYDELLGNIDKLLELRSQPSLPAPVKRFVDTLAGRHFAAIRIFWPSKKFTDEDLIPGGGAASVAAETENTAALLRALERLKEAPSVLGGPEVDEAAEARMKRAKELVPQLDVSAEAKREFVELVRGVLDDSAREVDDRTASSRPMRKRSSPTRQRR